VDSTRRLQPARTFTFTSAANGRYA
jgi:hypothetical protein